MSAQSQAGDWRVAKSPEAVLTRREWEILDLVRRGHSNIEIGRLLGISRITVRNHLTNVYDKLNVSNRQQAVARAFKLTPPADPAPAGVQRPADAPRARTAVADQPPRPGY